MSLPSGTRLGPYEILAPLGAGGMGEVYRARDTRLGRDVAIKVLPASLALDPDRLTRFEREARVLASLNHPNIAAIYGVEQAGDRQALVLELVEGETLDARLKTHASGLPAGDAVAIAHDQPRWTRDSSALIYYTPGATALGTLWEISALGGPPRRLGPALGGGDVSHDGRHVAAFQFEEGHLHLASIALDGSGAHRLVQLPSPAMYKRPRCREMTSS
jgi:hypothetical protein